MPLYEVRTFFGDGVCVLIEYGKGKFVSVMPVKEREFVELLEKRLTDYIL